MLLPSELLGNMHPIELLFLLKGRQAADFSPLGYLGVPGEKHVGSRGEGPPTRTHCLSFLVLIGQK